MRLIGSLPSESEADSLTAYLLTQSIDCHVEPDGKEGFDVWVKDEDGFEKAKSEFALFREDPKAEKYRKAVTEARKIHEANVTRQRQYKKNVRSGPIQKGLFEAAPLTMVMVMICAVVALLSNFGATDKTDKAVARALQFVSVDSPGDELLLEYRSNPDSMNVRLASIYNGELWRTVSPIFYHYGPFHIVFNMMWLIYFGRMIEERYGTVTMAMIVIFSAIVSNTLQSVVPVAVDGSVPSYLNNLLISRFGGMSGVNYALFGFIWFRMLYDPKSRLQLSQMTIIIMIGYLFYCMFSPNVGSLLGGGGGRVANWAHGAGMVMGLLLGLSPIGKMFVGKKK